MEWKDLKELVDRWHKAASELDGYQDTTPSGDGIQLVLLANRTKEGNLRLAAWSVKDLFSVISPEEMYQQGTGNKQFPQAEITISGA